MIWFLGFLGLALALLGLWGGPAQRPKRKEAEALARKQATVSEAWDVLAKPFEDEVIKIPEHRPWFTPGGDRRFQRGLMLGLGAGLLVSALTVTFLPKGEAPGQVAANDAGGTKQSQNQTPVTTQPQTPVTTAPATPPPAPVNVNFTVDAGDLPPTIAEKLVAQKLITDPDAFLQRITELKVDTQLKAGTFVIPTGAPLDKVIEALIS